MTDNILQIVVPCYNPDRGWELILEEKFNELQRALPEAVLHLTLVNDGSVRDISDSLQQLKERIPGFQVVAYAQNKGKGYALRKGFEAVSGNSFIYTDIDFPYTIQSMVDIYRQIQNGMDVVIGVREKEYYDKVPVRRAIISKTLKKLIKYLLSVPISDTQCGLKGFSNKGREIFLRTSIDRFLFDMQFVQLAYKTKGVKVTTQVVHPREGIVFSHMNYKVLLRESVNFLKLAVLPKR